MTDDPAARLRTATANLALSLEQARDPRRPPVPWIIPAALSWSGVGLFAAALILLFSGYVGWWAAVMLAAGAPLGVVVLLVPAEGPYWKRR